MQIYAVWYLLSLTRTTTLHALQCFTAAAAAFKTEISVSMCPCSCTYGRIESFQKNPNLGLHTDGLEQALTPRALTILNPKLCNYSSTLRLEAGRQTEAFGKRTPSAQPRESRAFSHVRYRL